MRFRINQLLIGKPSILVFLVGLSALTVMSQDSSDRWLRVLTDEDSMIEVNRLSLVLEPDQVIRADFRTTFTNPASKAGGSYKSRLDSIQFRLDDKRYRIRESKFVDGSGHVVSSTSTSDTSVWKSALGRTGRALFSAATQIRPFGTWRVVSYRYASGEAPSKDEPAELTALVGSGIYLGFDRVQVSRQRCDSPILEPTVMKADDFSHRVGTPLDSVGITDHADALYVRCKGIRQSTQSYERPTLKRRQNPASGVAPNASVVPSNEPVVDYYLPSNFPTLTLMLRPADDRILLLWDGVFLELERTKNIFLPRSY